MNTAEQFLIGFIVGSVVIASLWALWDYEPIKYEKKRKK